MALIVQKYGGTSVGDTDRIMNVARRIKGFVDEGNKVVVVVSARSGVTNALIERAKALNENPDEREMDMLLAVGEQETIALTAMALHSLGVKAESRTGAQAGIHTDFAHTRARITEITGGDIPKLLDEGKVVIVAGFQGVDDYGNVTTLGRGGSDLSAIALAATLKADICQIYGTKYLCENLKQIDAIKVAGGGDIVSAVNNLGYNEHFSHISTGGGATLSYLQGDELPGLINIPIKE